METPANGGAIFIYPEGRLRDGSDTGWENDSTDSEDLSFMEALFQKYTGELCIDQNRVFAYGHSWGGNMSNRMGCALSFIRGIGPIAGSGPSTRQDDPCVGSVPAMIVHNPLDGITNVDQGLGARAYWVGANNCTNEDAFQAYVPGVPIEVSADETAPPTLNNYLGCDAGFPVVWVEHHYTRNDNHNPPPWGPAVIWDFFSRL
jgi:poly(3-hydroxybutyrate) depolymerase